MPGPRIILHGGFHKTGTTSAQRFLRANGKHIYPRCALVLPGKLRKGAALYAVRYARFGTAALIDEFGRALHAVLSRIDRRNRAVLISDENLAGRMPGREGQRGYIATPALMARAEDVICDVFGAEADVVFHFTTRAPEAWLRSTWRHNLAHGRLTLNYEDYVAMHAPDADLIGVADAVTKAVTGRVQTANLGDLTGPWGPAAPLIDLIGLPAHLRRRLVPQPPQNVGPPEAFADELLALNRSALSDADVARAKADLMTKGPTP